MTTRQPRTGENAEWFERWFGEEYLEIYPHRDVAEAREATDTVLRTAGPELGSRSLDLGCGAGRHVEALRERGMRCVGLDLSEVLLARARAAGLPVVRGDMRDLPFRSEAFDLVTSFFTSFGYFEDPGDDLAVLREVRRVLRPGAAFAFDYLNAERVRNELRTRDEREVNGRRVVQTRVLSDGGRRVEKRIEIFHPGREPQVFHERVRLYEADALARILAGANLRPRTVLGDYRGVPLASDSPRVLIIGTAE